MLAILCAAMFAAVLVPDTAQAAKAEYQAYLETEQVTGREDQWKIHVYLSSDGAKAPSAAQVDLTFEGLNCLSEEASLSTGMASSGDGTATVTFMTNRKDFDSGHKMEMGTFTFEKAKGAASQEIAIADAVAVKDSREAAVSCEKAAIHLSGTGKAGNDAGKQGAANAGAASAGETDAGSTNAIRAGAGENSTADKSDAADNDGTAANRGAANDSGTANNSSMPNNSGAAGELPEAGSTVQNADEQGVSSGSESAGEQGIGSETEHAGGQGISSGEENAGGQAADPAGAQAISPGTIAIAVVVIIVVIAAIAAAAAILVRRKKKPNEG